MCVPSLLALLFGVPGLLSAPHLSRLKPLLSFSIPCNAWQLMDEPTTLS